MVDLKSAAPAIPMKIPFKISLSQEDLFKMIAKDAIEGLEFNGMSVEHHDPDYGGTTSITDYTIVVQGVMDLEALRSKKSSSHENLFSMFEQEGEDNGQ